MSFTLFFIFLKEGYPHLPWVWWKTFPFIRSVRIILTAPDPLFHGLQTSSDLGPPYQGFQGNMLPSVLIFLWRFPIGISKPFSVNPMACFPLFPSLLKNLLARSHLASSLERTANTLAKNAGVNRNTLRVLVIIFYQKSKLKTSKKPCTTPFLIASFRFKKKKTNCSLLVW